MHLLDFNDSRLLPDRGYGGHRGRKIAVLHEGEPWMLKFPNRRTSALMYATERRAFWMKSPVCEYIGSKIYAALGIPVQEVRLGVYEGKLVAACRDFTMGARLLDFAQIKNAVGEDLLDGGSRSYPGGELFSNALTVIEKADVFSDLRDAVIERFWDMFVTDAFLLNDSRSNEDWGLLVKPYATGLAPVYDNGNALFNQRTSALMETTLFEPEELVACPSLGCTFFAHEWNRVGTPIAVSPFDVIRDMDDYDCNMAVLRFEERFDLDRVGAIIEELPEWERGVTVAPSETKAFYKRLLRSIAERLLLPCARKIRERYEGGDGREWVVTKSLPGCEDDDAPDFFTLGRCLDKFATYAQAEDYMNSLERRGVTAEILMPGHPALQDFIDE